MHARLYAGVLLFLLLVSSVLIVSVSLASEHRANTLSVSFLNVGQGDAIFIETPNGTQVLIDGGKNDAVLRELSSQMSFWDRTIDVVIATHPDLDHIGGLPSVFARYEVDKYFEPGVFDDGADYTALMGAVVEEGLEPIILRGGMTLELDYGVSLTTLFPMHDATHMDPNTASLILLLSYGDTTFLLTGDAPASIERYLVERQGTILRSDVLKLGHHGSDTSSDVVFLSLVDPGYAVVSAGCDNQYGHPHNSVVARVQALGAKLVETCTGTVRFQSDGVSLELVE